MVKFEVDSTTRRPKPPLVDFEDTQANTELPPEVQEIWRDSSIDLEHGLDIDELPIDSLPGEWQESFR